jgi:Asp-tRNA(Asn)/Glu-tRNA(Gln) amidotransferase A subunit family amidase
VTRERSAEVATGLQALPDAVPTVAEALATASLARTGGAYAVVTTDEATATAEALARSGDRRALAGVPFAVKDLMRVAGHRLGAGSATRDDAPVETVDAEIVGRLRGLGAVLVGLTVPHEIALGVTGVNDHAGTPDNPAAAGRIPGGSSSGSAVAVAEGSAAFALGTDTGGSVRIPAALCGIVGFKPGRGTYPTAGVLPLAPTLDHVGLLAPSVDVIRAVHTALGQAVGRPRLPRHVGVPEAALEAAAPAVADRVEQALRALESRGVVLVRTPWVSYDHARALSTTVMFAEAAAVHAESLARSPEQFGADVRARLQQGAGTPAPEYIAARRDGERLRTTVTATLEELDVVAEPTVGIEPPSLSDELGPDVAAELVRTTRLANVTGSPSLTLPLGGGLPVGLQLTARSDAHLLGIATEVETVLDGLVR